MALSSAPPRPRAERWWLRVALVAASALSPVACGEDTTPATDAGPTGQPKLEITSPADQACIAIGDDPHFQIPVTVKATELRLRPPGVCDVPQCGYLVLSANGVVRAQSATSTLQLSFNVPNSYTT